jgi:hypothetical protein
VQVLEEAAWRGLGQCKPRSSEGCLQIMRYQSCRQQQGHLSNNFKNNSLAISKKTMAAYISHLLEWLRLCMLVLWRVGLKAQIIALDFCKNTLLPPSKNAEV